MEQLRQFAHDLSCSRIELVWQGSIVCTCRRWRSVGRQRFFPFLQRSALAAMATMPGVLAAAVSPAVSKAAGGSPRAAAATWSPKHVVPAAAIERKRLLKQAQEAAGRQVRSVKAELGKQARERKSLLQKAQNLPLAILRQVLQTKNELPDIECPNCTACMDNRQPLEEAFLQVERCREVHPTMVGRPLDVGVRQWAMSACCRRPWQCIWVCI